MMVKNAQGRIAYVKHFDLWHWEAYQKEKYALIRIKHMDGFSRLISAAENSIY